MNKVVKWYSEGWTCDCGTLVLIDLDCHECGKKEPEYTEGNQDRFWDDEYEFSFPAKNIVCPCCDGTGSTYLGWHSSEQPAFTAEDFYEEGPDFYEDYMGGRYDRQCPECKGRNVIGEIVEKAIPKAHKPIWEAYCDHLRFEAEYAAEVAAERRMGA